MSRRVRYIGVVRSGDGAHQFSSWITRPGSRKEDISYILFGKVEASYCKLEVTSYMFDNDVLSESIYSKDEQQAPCCVAVHPGGDGVVCFFRNMCKLYELRTQEPLRLEDSCLSSVDIDDIGEQSHLMFSVDGTKLAACGEDGHLRVFQWPSLKTIFQHPEGHKFAKDMDISLDGAFVALLSNDGSLCHVWEIDNSTLVATITPSKGEKFGFCRFSRDGTKPFLFTTISKGVKGIIAVWEMESWSKVGARGFSESPITSFSINHNGKQLAIGNGDGNIHLVEVKKMAIVERFQSAHMSKIIFLQFSPNGRALISISDDSTARVTSLKVGKEWKDWQLYLLLLLMVLGSFLLFGLFYEYSDSFWQFPLGRQQPARPPYEAIYGNYAYQEHDDL